jgi:hypothetical protein
MKAVKGVSYLLPSTSSPRRKFSSSMGWVTRTYKYCTRSPNQIQVHLARWTGVRQDLESKYVRVCQICGKVKSVLQSTNQGTGNILLDGISNQNTYAFIQLRASAIFCLQQAVAESPIHQAHRLGHRAYVTMSPNQK